MTLTGAQRQRRDRGVIRAAFERRMAPPPPPPAWHPKTAPVAILTPTIIDGIEQWRSARAAYDVTAANAAAVRVALARGASADELDAARALLAAENTTPPELDSTTVAAMRLAVSPLLARIAEVAGASGAVSVGSDLREETNRHILAFKMSAVRSRWSAWTTTGAPAETGIALLDELSAWSRRTEALIQRIREEQA